MSGPRATADVDEYVITERAALIAWHLAHGEGMRTSDVVALTGLERQGAWKLMCRLSRVLPIYQDDIGVWQVNSLREI